MVLRIAFSRKPFAFHKTSALPPRLSPPNSFTTFTNSSGRTNQLFYRHTVYELCCRRLKKTSALEISNFHTRSQKHPGWGMHAEIKEALFSRREGWNGCLGKTAKMKPKQLLFQLRPQLSSELAGLKTRYSPGVAGRQFPSGGPAACFEIVGDSEAMSGGRNCPVLKRVESGVSACLPRLNVKLDPITSRVKHTLCHDVTRGPTADWKERGVGEKSGHPCRKVRNGVWRPLRTIYTVNPPNRRAAASAIGRAYTKDVD